MFLRRKSYLPTLSTQVVMGKRRIRSSRARTITVDFSFVNYFDPNSCAEAVREMDHLMIDGFILLVNQAAVTGH